MPFKPVDRALKIVFGPLIDAVDFITREESIAFNAAGMEIDINVELTDGTVVTTAVVPTAAGNYDWAHLDQGYYELELPAAGGISYNNTFEGILTGLGFATGVLPFRTIAAYDVINEDVYDGMVLGNDPVPGPPSAVTAAITAWIEGYLAIKLTPTVLAETHVGALPAALVWGPIESAPTVVLRNVRTLTDDVDFIWAETAQMWPLVDMGTGIWEIAYTAGYAVVPTGLQQAIDQFAADVAADEGYTSRRLGDYSYTVKEEHVNRHLYLLDPWKRLFA